MDEKELFRAVFTDFQEKYHGLELRGTLVYYNDECRFSIEGFSLLYNLTRLCKVLELELL